MAFEKFSEAIETGKKRPWVIKATANDLAF